MMVLIVVPAEIVLTPAAGMRSVFEAARVVRLVFLGLELASLNGLSLLTRGRLWLQVMSNSIMSSRYPCAVIGDPRS